MVLVDVDETAKIVEFCVNSTPARKEILKSPNIFWFRRTLFELYLFVRIMCIQFCPLQIFAINYLKADYSQHYEICTSLKMKPPREINFSSSIEYLCF